VPALGSWPGKRIYLARRSELDHAGRSRAWQSHHGHAPRSNPFGGRARTRSPRTSPCCDPRGECRRPSNVHHRGGYPWFVVDRSTACSSYRADRLCLVVPTKRLWSPTVEGGRSARQARFRLLGICEPETGGVGWCKKHGRRYGMLLGRFRRCDHHLQGRQIDQSSPRTGAARPGRYRFLPTFLCRLGPAAVEQGTALRERKWLPR
jgi:hypothetical protein